MLKTKINIKDIKIKQTLLKNCNFTIIKKGNNGEITINVFSENHHLKNGDNILFIRNDGPQISYSNRYTVSVTDKNHFNIAVNIRYPLYINSVNTASVRTQALDSRKKDIAFITFSNEHVFCENKDYITNIDGFFDKNYTFSVPSGVMCKDYRYFIFNDFILYKSKLKDNLDNYVLLPNDVINTSDRTIYLSNGKTFQHCIVPCNNNKDNLYKVFCETSMDVSETAFNHIQAYSIDERFFKVFSETDIHVNEKLKLKPKTNIYKIENTLNTNVLFGEDFGLDINKDENIKKKYTEGLINPIIDYERQMFIPIYTTNDFTEISSDWDNNIYDVNKIKFNIHLRERTGDGWDKDENSYWNTFSISDNKYSLKATHGNRGLDCGDPLGLIGFTGDDIYNMNERLKKTFIRLLFYDTPDRNTQTLLFYSTIFLDANKLHANYLRQIITNNGFKEDIINEYQPNENMTLSCEFEVQDMFHNDGSSEGFYLYLFPNIVDGNNITTLYMKVEFNHAKYGKTVPLVMPYTNGSDGKIKRTGFSDNDFPITYLKKVSGQVSMNMSKLYEDMYIKIGVKFDYEKSRYIWFFITNEKWAGNDGIINISLFEPKTDVNQEDINNI